MPGKNKFWLILILGLLTAIGPFSIDMYLPGFPNIAADLNTTVAHVALSLSSFFIGISFGQFLYGPLLDRYGRKKPLYIGLSLYVLASAGCAFASTADMLIAWRLLQALGGCAGMVASRAMVRDLFPVEENAKVFSMLMLVVGVSPIIAPTVGGYLSASVGWRYVFAVLTGMSVLILAAVHFSLPESRRPDRSISLKPKPIIKGYAVVLKEPQFYTYAFTGSVAAAGLYAYISGSPYVFMKLFKTTEQEYGWIFAFAALGLILSTQVNTLLLKKYKSEQIIVVALIFQGIAGIMLFAGSLYNFLGLFGTIFLIFIFLSCQGCIFPNSSALSMAPFSKNAGSASALMGGIQMAIGASASALVSVFSNHSALPMTGVMCACTLLSSLILRIGNRVVRYKASIAMVEEEANELISTT